MSAIREVTPKFGKIYIDTLVNISDEKVRIYDSRREYMSYMEAESLYDKAFEAGVTPEEVLGSIIQDAEHCSTIEELIELLVYDEYELITSSPAIVAKHLFGYDEIPAKIERKILRSVLQNEFVNMIGDYYIVIKE